MNLSTNISGLETGVEVSSVIVLSLATVFGTIGNLYLLLVIATTPGVRTIETVFVTNLAISDLYVTLVADPMGIIGETSMQNTPAMNETTPYVSGNVLTPFVSISCTIVIAIASLLGSGGNVYHITAVSMYQSVTGVEKVLSINLALSDLFITAVGDPMNILAKLHGAEFFDNIPGLCQTVASLCTISCVSSLMTIALMSVNRYFYICQNERYRIIFTYRNVICMCLSLYGIGTFLVLLNLAGIGDHSFDHKSYECIWDRMATFPYTVVFSVTLVWVPTVITGTCYLKIYLFVSAHRRKIRQQSESSEIQNQKSMPSPRKLHLAKTLFTIYAVFTACWIPYALLIVVDSNDDFPHEVHVYITMWAHLHPSLNWIIYYLTNKKFADAYKQLFNKCFGSCCRCETTPEETNHVVKAGRSTSRQGTETSPHTTKHDQLKLETINESELQSLDTRNGHRLVSSEA